jgi:hypothetical protein
MMRMDAGSRVSISAALIGLASIVLAAGLMMVEAIAHHPGSHAARQGDRQVRLQVVANVTDGCTAIAAIRRGVPTGAQAPAGVDPVIVQLRRPPAETMCAQVIRTLRAEAVLDTPGDIRALHVFTLAADGRVTATERVPIQ